ncbi:MAG: DUF3429 domain-containing protein [Herminiimonas sp.]|nr:DUF3429 domain-containing protein [Herminiimonas sp.]
MNSHFLNKRVAYTLGFAGLAPFAMLSLACWMVRPDWLLSCIQWQLAYGVAILSFLGGIHWGAALMSSTLTEQQSKNALVWSVVPALIAWSSTMVGRASFAVLIVGFIAAYQVDKRLFAWYGLPEWFIRLRFMLTCVVVAALALTVFAATMRL